jgi:hypothetical protein
MVTFSDRPRICNFSRNIRSLLQTISTLPRLHILHIDGQRLSDGDVGPVMDDLRSHRETLFESSCDNSRLSTAGQFCAFYEYINALNERAIGHPQADLARLFRRAAASMPGRFESFRRVIQKCFPAKFGTIRPFYMCKQNPDGDFSRRRCIRGSKSS